MQWRISSGPGAAWPVANPVVTCADVAEAGFPSSFVANSFLFIQVGELCFAFLALLEIYSAFIRDESSTAADKSQLHKRVGILIS